MIEIMTAMVNTMIMAVMVIKIAIVMIIMMNDVIEGMIIAIISIITWLQDDYHCDNYNHSYIAAYISRFVFSNPVELLPLRPTFIVFISFFPWKSKIWFLPFLGVFVTSSTSERLSASSFDLWIQFKFVQKVIPYFFPHIGCSSWSSFADLFKLVCVQLFNKYETS